MRKVLPVIVLAAALFSAPAAFSKNVWRECGIGGMIFQKTGWAAITSNVIWDLGTTATSSNVSSDDMCEGKSASTGKFINRTYASIEEQTAVGNGEHIVAMLNILGCQQSSHNQIIDDVRSGLQQRMMNPDFSSQQSVEKAEDYFNGLMGVVESQYKKECGII